MSIAGAVRKLLKEHPFIEDSISLGIVNLSKVAVLFQSKIEGSTFQAVHAALRREAEEIIKKKENIQKNVLRVLANSEVAIKSGLVSIKIKSSPEVNGKLLRLLDESKEFTLIKGLDIYTLITNDKLLAKKIGNAIEVNEGLSGVFVKSPEDVLYTKGFVAFVTNLLAKEGINLIDFIQSYVNTIIIVDKKDASKVYSLLINYTK